MAHRHSPYASSSSGKLRAKEKIVCLSGLKEGIRFIDGNKRVFHSTYRATHYLLAGTARVSHLDEQPHRNPSPPDVEKSIHLETRLDAPEESVCISDRQQLDFPSRGKNITHLAIGYTDTNLEEKKSGGFGSSVIFKSLPGAPSLLPREPYANGRPDHCSSQGVSISTSLGTHMSRFEIQKPCGVSDFGIGQPKETLTTDLQPEVHSCDSKGLHNGDAKHRFCTVENICNNDDDCYNVVLQENDYMSACIKDCFYSAENLFCDDNNDMGNVVSEEHEIVSACIGSCSMIISVSVESVCNNLRNNSESLFFDKNDVMSVCTCDCSNEKFNALMLKFEVGCLVKNTALDPANASVDCWCGANNSSLQISILSDQSRRRVPRVFTVLLTSPPHTCGSSIEKLFSCSFLTAQCRLMLLKVFGLLNMKNLGGELEFLAEQVIVYANYYIQFCKSRYPSIRGRREIAVSCYFRQFSCKQVEKELILRDGHFKKINVLVIVQDNLKFHLRERRHHTLPLALSLEYSSSGMKQSCHCASIFSTKVGDSRFFCPLKVKQGKGPRMTKSLSDDFNGSSRILEGFLEHKKKEFVQSRHNVFSDMSGGCALKLQNLLEMRDGGKIGSSKSPCENFKNSFRFPPRSCSNKGANRSSGSTARIFDWLDDFVYKLHDHPACFLCPFTPELRLFDSVIMGNASLSASANYFLGDVHSQISVVYANGNENDGSCLPLADPNSHTLPVPTASMSFDAEEPISFLPYGGVHERQSREKLKHFAEGFLLRCHIRRLQQRAQQAPPYPPRGSAHKYQRASSGNASTNPHTACFAKESRGNNNELATTLTSLTTDRDRDRFAGADVVIDIVGLVRYIEGQCIHVKAFSDPLTNSINYAEMPLIAGQLVISNFSAMIVTIIAIVVYTKTLLEGGLAWVGGARTQKEEDN
ncbi:hypothetical protein L7F22_062015 [Adiantum nelumboides]|nr:hypothetical protein [Adiantum nelumboides]